MCRYYIQISGLASSGTARGQGRTDSGLQGLEHGSFLLILILPCPEAEGWDSGTGIEFLKSVRRHFAS
jgi:hypothetical protein